MRTLKFEGPKGFVQTEYDDTGLSKDEIKRLDRLCETMAQERYLKVLEKRN